MFIGKVIFQILNSEQKKHKLFYHLKKKKS